jgi:hypothetical protein
MLSQRDKRFFPAFGKWLRRAFAYVREPVAYIAVVLTYVAAALHDWRLGLSSVAIWATILVRITFEIHERTEPTTVRRFKDQADARMQFEECLRIAGNEDGFLQVKIIGMTMYDKWAMQQGAFDRLVGVREVRVEVAMLDSAWLDQNPINPAWTGQRADVLAADIDSYVGRNAQRLKGLNWSFVTRRYKHMPMIHGTLVNEKYLFVGISCWEDKSLRAGDRPLDFYSFRDGEGALHKIDIFQRWFDFSFGQKPGWYEPQPSNPAQGPQASKSRKPPQTSGGASAA